MPFRTHSVMFRCMPQLSILSEPNPKSSVAATSPAKQASLLLYAQDGRVSLHMQLLAYHPAVRFNDLAFAVIAFISGNLVVSTIG